MLPGISGLSGLGSSAKTVTYLSLTGSGVDASSYTLSGTSLGAPAADRYIVAVVWTDAVAGSISISSVTIGGVSASLVTSASTSGTVLAMYIANVPTGTTGDVVASFSATSDDHHIALWALTGLTSTTPIDTDSNTSNAALTMTSEVGGVIIGAAWAADPITYTWSGATENYDSNYIATRTASGASGSTTATSTIIDPTPSGAADAYTFIAATF